LVAVVYTTEYLGNVMKPTYYKALWHNCHKCKIHFMSEEPHIRAYLCDDCWYSMPHFKVTNVKRVKKEKPRRVQIYLKDFSITEILLYSIGNIIWLIIIGYYLWFK